MRRSSHAGFSLLEILVAFTLLAIAMAVLMQIFSRGVNNADAADRYAKASMLAESLMTTIGVENPLVEGELTGEFADGYSWRANIKLYSSSAEPESMIVNSPANVQVDPNATPPQGINTGFTLGRVGGANVAGAAGAGGAPSAGGTAPTLGQASTLTAANTVDIETLLPVRLYEVELLVSFKTDDGRERTVALNTLKMGPRP